MIRTLLLTTAIVATSVTAASATPPSGMLLGIYAFPNYQGLRVTRTMPEYSAHGKLFPNDVVTRVTADGNTIYPTRSFGQFEYAKDQIGPNVPAALEVFRPGIGHIYLWVEFIPVGGQIGIASEPVVKARIMTEAQKPGASRLFNRSGSKPSGPQNPPRFDKGRLPNRGNSGGAAGLFGS
jgi:hypothetical protein